MGIVPKAYYEFVMHYAPFFYVVPTAMAMDPPAGQRNVVVVDGSRFREGYPIEVKDNSHSEWNRV
ncbi:MAG: hypothetical protein QXK90_02270, partial [Candidatus Parvarchaeota archaeon]